MPSGRLRAFIRGMVARAEGQIVAGRFRLTALLGEGGMGEVWAATHTITRRRAALKFVKGADASPERRGRLLREARAAAGVDHPNVIEVVDVFELDDGTPVMVMELLSGESLAARLARTGTLDVPEAADVLLQVVSAVGAAHAAGVVHRDLGAGNVFLAEDAGATRVKVLDFGVAKLVGEPGGGGVVTSTGAVLGTPPYMAPEQAFGEKDVDHRADVWAIGVMGYELFAGCKPVEGDNLAQIVKRLATEGITPLRAVAPGVPDDLAALVDRMLAKDRDKRPPLQAVAGVLARYASVRVPGFGPPAPVAAR